MTRLLRTPSRFTRPPPSFETIFDGIFSEMKVVRICATGARRRRIGSEFQLSFPPRVRQAKKKKKIRPVSEFCIFRKCCFLLYEDHVYCSASCIPASSLWKCVSRMSSSFFHTLYNTHTIVTKVLQEDYILSSVRRCLIVYNKNQSEMNKNFEFRTRIFAIFSPCFFMIFSSLTSFQFFWRVQLTR